MLLAIDIGNTNIHMGLCADGEWIHSWRARTVADKMPDEYAMLIRNFLRDADFEFSAVTGVIVSSVVPQLTQIFTEMSERYFALKPLIVNHKTRTGVTIDIDQPRQAGADRIVNSAAVVALYGGPAIVIDFGTATTFDVVSAEGAYVGGAIAPGINAAHDALVSRAARLHKVALTPPPNPIGRNTSDAMQSGIFWGYVGLIEGLVARLKEAMPDEQVTVIATGGLAPLVFAHTDVIDILAPELTLDGLRIIYNLNRE